jgi:hypothetical protein
MEIRLMFLIILILCIWLLVSDKGKKMILNFRNNIQNMISKKPIDEVETDG